MCDPTKLDDFCAAGSALSPADRRALLYPVAAASPTIHHLSLRWVTLFTPVFVAALLLLLGGMFATLASATPTLAVLILQTGTALLALLAIKIYRISWQVLLIAAAVQARSTAVPVPDRRRGRRAWKAWWQ